MNKFLKEIDREIEKYKLEDKIVLKLREELHLQLLMSDEWKERYLSVKRFEKKKLKKEEEDDLLGVNIDLNLEDPNKQNQILASDGLPLLPYTPQLLSTPPNSKKKYYIKNG